VLAFLLRMARTTRSSSSAAALRASSSSPNSNTSDPSAPAPVTSSISASSNHNNHSISYLAPFVASVLRDQVVADLLAESKRKEEIIQQQAEDRLRVEITGRHGDPVYYEASMKHAFRESKPDGMSVWHVPFDFDPRYGTNTTVPNFVETVAGLELRVGGIVVFKFNGAIFCKRSVEMTDEPQMGKVDFLSSDDGVRVCSRVGPIRHNDFVTYLPRQCPVTNLVRGLKDYQTINNTDAVLLPQLQIQSVHVHESQINGILPLLNDTTGETSTSE